ncbi:MAG: T9SS type A sorting domain-containing protein [Bacteroidota bacterium]
MKFFTTSTLAIRQWLFLLLLLCANISTAQTWTGNVDSDWATAGNWDTNTVPSATSDVIIGSTANDPIINGDESALSVTVTNTTLTVNGTLEIANSADDGISILSGSTVTINGTTTIGNTVDDGITIKGNSSLVVSGTLTINDVPDDGIDIARGTSTIQDGGVVTINSAAEFGIEIENDTLSIEAGGKLIINGNDATADGIVAFSGAELIEVNGDLEIRDLRRDGIDFSTATAKLLVGSTGHLVIENTVETGLEEVVGTNNGLIEMSNLGALGIEIRTDSSFVNNGEVAITTCGESGIDGEGTFTNTNKLSISDCSQFVLNNIAFNHSTDATFLADGSVSSTVVTNFSANSILAPGSSPGCLSFKQNESLAGVVLEVEIDGSVVCDDYDQISVLGTIDITDATLDLSGTYSPETIGETFLLIDNDDTDAVVGAFSGLAEGAILELNGAELQLSYQGGDGNDVELTVTGLPAICSITAEQVIVQCLDNDTYGVTVYLSGMNSGYTFQNFAVEEPLSVTFTPDPLVFTNDSDSEPLTQASVVVIYEEGVDYSFGLFARDEDPVATNNEPCILEVFGDAENCEACSTVINDISTTPSEEDGATGSIEVDATNDEFFTLRYRIYPDPNDVGWTTDNTFNNLPAGEYTINVEEFGSDFQCGAVGFATIEEGVEMIELNEVEPEPICTIGATVEVDLTQYEADLTDESGAFTYFDEEGNEITTPTNYEVSNGEAIEVVFNADDGRIGMTDLVFTIDQVVINNESITIDILCEGVEPGTCPPIDLNWETPKIEVNKYLARIVVATTEETFERMLKGTVPFLVRPFLPPRILGEDVYIELAPVAEDGTIGKFSTPRLFVVDCDSTLPILEDRSEQIIDNLTLVPNPVQDVLFLNFPNPNAESVQIEIRDGMGRIVRQLKVATNQVTLNVEDLPNGHYAVLVKKGEEQKVKQFVIIN